MVFAFSLASSPAEAFGLDDEVQRLGPAVFHLDDEVRDVLARGRAQVLSS